MFKAKLIENYELYTKRRKIALWLSLIPWPMINIFIWNNISVLVGVLLVIANIAFFIFLYKQNKLVKNTIGDKIIEISDLQLVISSPKEGKVNEFDLQVFDTIMVPKTFEIPDDNISTYSKSVIGNSINNYIRIKDSNTDLRFDFLLDSYYMISQLENILSKLSAKGINVVRE